MKTYYHNVTRDIVNQSDVVEFIDYYFEGDVVYKSEAGNACIELLIDEEIEALKQEAEQFRIDNPQMYGDA